MSSLEFDQLLALLPTLAPEQLQLLQERIDATTPLLTLTSEEEADQTLQRKLYDLGLLSEIKPSRRPNGDRVPPIIIEGEPLSETIIRERR